MSPEPSRDLAAFDEEEVEAEQTQEEIAAQISERGAALARLAQEAAEISVDAPDDGQGGALVPSNQTAKQAKRQIAALRAAAMRQTERLQKKQDEMEAVQQEIANLMREQLALAEERLAPIQKYVARLEEGIWMVNLYLGRDEEIIALREGEAAPADEPVVIRQLVLAMDEECAINPEDDGIDSTNIEEFDEWLKADPAHVDQVLPETKGVVALRPRFRSKSYEDPWKAQAVAEEDRKTYFLIRNGDKLWRTWTEFNAGERLVPRADEFASFFFEKDSDWNRRREGREIRVPITPGTPAWERAEEAADARQRHFMRVALILQGLVDRTTVFHPLPERGISFMDHEQGGKTWRFLSDAENLLTTGRQPFYEWLAEKNATLRVGMRIAGAFSARGFTSHEYDNHYRNSRVRPPSAPNPQSNVLHVIEDKEGKAFVIRYERNDKIWKRNVPIPERPGWVRPEAQVPASRRASALILPDDKFVLPFDLVNEQEMTIYLGARGDRHAYADMFPLLKAAILLKREEREEEAPFRLMLAGVLARDNGVDVSEAEAALDSLIEWWKLTNRNHRPLVGDEESQVKAVRMIVAEHKRRLKADAKGIARGMIARLCDRHPDALAIGRRRDGRYVAIVPYGDGPFVARHNYGARGAQSTVEEWKLLRKANLAALTIGYASERLAGWDLNASLLDHLTGPEYDQMIEAATKDAKKNQVIAVAYDAKDHEIHAWRFKSDAVIDEERPLSGKHTEVKVDHTEQKWMREGRAVRLREAHRSYRSSASMYQRKPWDSRSKPGKRHSPFGGDDGADAENRYVVVYLDAELDAHVEAEEARYSVFEERARTMAMRAEDLLDSIEKAWVKRREGEEYARFLEDFLDPELWEGHRKTLPRDTFTYPHHHAARGGSLYGDDDALAALVTYAVEQNIDLVGMTVWEAATAHFPPLSFFGKRRRADTPPEAIDIPEDLRTLRFAATEPVPDEDDE